jgi:hypothetical protein
MLDTFVKLKPVVFASSSNNILYSPLMDYFYPYSVVCNEALSWEQLAEQKKIFFFIRVVG